jgi:endonuclease YncB( thermonuclease family)
MKRCCCSINKYKLNKCTLDNPQNMILRIKCIYVFMYLCKVLSVYDGDTITIAIKLDKHYFQRRVRMYGYESPEMKPLKKLKNRDEIIKNAKIAKNVLEDKILSKIVECHIIGFDKYGWILANIIYSGENINDLCVEFGHIFDHK